MDETDLQRKIDELAAQVERLRDIVNRLEGLDAKMYARHEGRVRPRRPRVRRKKTPDAD